MNKGFNVANARKKLLVMDYISLGMCIMAILISLICLTITRIPYVLFIFRTIIIASLFVSYINIKNIISYYKKNDELFKFI